MLVFKAHNVEQTAPCWYTFLITFITGRYRCPSSCS